MQGLESRERAVVPGGLPGSMREVRGPSVRAVGLVSHVKIPRVMWAFHAKV